MKRIMMILLALVIIALGFAVMHWVKQPLQPAQSISNNCSSCHLSSVAEHAWTEAPKWHEESFCNPAASSKNRDRHMRVALTNRKSCMECHAARFQAQCANCHTPEEWHR